MVSRKEYKLTWNEMVARDKATIDKICSDDDFAYYFVYTACEPLLKKIMWTIFENNAEFDELANELYVHLKKPGKDGDLWHNLKTFDHRTSLFDWIKTVATRLFVDRKNEDLVIPQVVIENGVISKIGFKLDKAIDRKLLKLYVIEQNSIESVCAKLDIEKKSFTNVYRGLVRKIANIIKKDFPEYKDLIYNNKVNNTIEDQCSNTCNSLEDKIDLESYVSLMPNKNYQKIIQRLYLDEISSEQMAVELNTPTSNVYNLKVRALDQLRDVVIFSADFPNLEKYIFMIPDDRLRSVATSLFIKGLSYGDIAKEHSITQSEFRQVKKQVLSELKRFIYKQKRNS